MREFPSAGSFFNYSNSRDGASAPYSHKDMFSLESTLLGSSTASEAEALRARQVPSCSQQDVPKPFTLSHRHLFIHHVWVSRSL